MKTQTVSVPHLVMGLVFLGLAGSWLLHENGVIGPVQVEWLLPLILVAAGAAGLVAALAKALPSRRTSQADGGADDGANHGADDRAGDRADDVS